MPGCRKGSSSIVDFTFPFVKLLLDAQWLGWSQRYQSVFRLRIPKVVPTRVGFLAPLCITDYGN